MSVQAGIWNFDGRPVHRELAVSFSEALKSQGPDDEGTYCKGNIAMLYRPFHTTAESWAEKQPYFSRRGYILTWDGRLDNRDELIADLGSLVRHQPTDVEIVATALDVWQTEAFCRFIGDWAVSIWRSEEQELILATDYMAVRHVFYHLKENSIWWSSDLGPLVLFSENKFRIDDDYIAGYIALAPDAHVTPYREIRQVAAGQFVRIRNGHVRAERYWRFNPKSRIRYKTDAGYEEHFRHLFRQAVRRRLRSDSPILAELSGGLDSSSIVCMADDILAKEGAPTPRVDTLSFCDQTEPNGDDFVFLQRIEEKRGRAGTHIDASRLGMSPDSLRYPDFTPLPGRLGNACQLEAERAAVVRDGGYRAILSGIGGDEFLGGVPNPRVQLADLIVQFRFVNLTKQLIAWSLAKRVPGIQLLSQSLLLLVPSALRCRLLKEAQVEPWIEEEFSKRTNLSLRQLGPKDIFGMWLPSRRADISCLIAMSNMIAKRMSPSLELEEARYPYLDQTLIEFLLSIPTSQLLRPSERRSLMRRSLVGIVPQEVLTRQTKQVGVRTPVVGLERNLEELQVAFQSALTSQKGYINQRRLFEALKAAKEGRKSNIPRLIKAVSLEFWLRDLNTLGLLNSDLEPPIGSLTPASLSVNA